MLNSGARDESHGAALAVTGTGAPGGADSSKLPDDDRTA